MDAFEGALREEGENLVKELVAVQHRRPNEVQFGGGPTIRTFLPKLRELEGYLFLSAHLDFIFSEFRVAASQQP